MSRNKIVVLILCLIALLFGGYYLEVEKGAQSTPSSPVSGKIKAFDPKNFSFMLDDQKVTLINGESEVEITPNSAIHNTVEYFGNDVYGDLNGDGISDQAFLLAESGGGSGTFFYVIVALTGASGYTLTDAVFLGDRIAPQNNEIVNGVLHVNYATRRDDEPMTATPSVAVTKYLKVNAENKLVEAK